MSAIFACLSTLLLFVHSSYADTGCKNSGGKCQMTYVTCMGTYKSDVCNGPWNRKCCIPFDQKCTSQGGTCQHTSAYCSGAYQSNICSGPSDRKCCVPTVSPPSPAPENQFESGSVSKSCLQCICDVESGCKPLNCEMDGKSLSCGYFQIKLVYYIDCYKPGFSWEACSKNKLCASKCVQQYMNRYANKCSNKNCECYARIHNGGPDGYKKASTVKYWQKVQSKGCKADS